jgi:hypothetical protein
MNPPGAAFHSGLYTTWKGIWRDDYAGLEDGVQYRVWKSATYLETNIDFTESDRGRMRKQLRPGLISFGVPRTSGHAEGGAHRGGEAPLF